MALTLPYDLVFTPLDVLTAEEMTHIVDNYTYIAQQFPISGDNIAGSSITTAKLGSQAVTSDKVNYNSVFASVSDHTTLNLDVTQSYTDLTSFSLSNIPNGAKFFAIGKTAFTGSSTITGVNTRLRYGLEYGFIGAVTTNWGRVLDTYGIFTKTTNNSIYIQAMKDNSTTIISTRAEIVAFRIG